MRRSVIKVVGFLKDIGKWFIISCIFIPFFLVALWITVKGYFIK